MEPTYTETFLFELEKKLLKKYKTYKNVEPKPVKIVESVDFGGQASDNAILVSTNFLKRNPTLKEVRDLLKHELLHYVCNKEGHNLDFIAKARKMKIVGDYENDRLLNEVNKSWLEGRLSIEGNEHGEEELIEHKRPSYDRFREYIIYSTIPLSSAFRSLREMNNLSVSEVSKRSGINESEILKIEVEASTHQFYTRDEHVLKKLFKAIVDKPRHSATN